MANLQSGRRLAFDFGSVRVGVSVSTIDGIFCSPQQAIQNNEQLIESVKSLLEEYDPMIIFVGLPLNLSGEFTKSTTSAIEFARAISLVSNIPIRLIDERLSTRAAQKQMQSSGKSVKQSRPLIDSATATLILESALEFEKNTDKLAGREITEFDE